MTKGGVSGIAPSVEETAVPGRETQPIQFPPQRSNCLQWNKDDGVLAAGAGTVVVVFDGSRCHGPVSYAAWRQGVPLLMGSSVEDFEKYEEYVKRERMQEVRADDEKKAKGKQVAKTSSHMSRGRDLDDFMDTLDTIAGVPGGGGIHGSLIACDMLQDAYWFLENPKVVSIAWSPCMCSEQGGSLLGVVFDDNSAMVFGPSDSLGPLWVPLVNLAPGRYEMEEEGEKKKKKKTGGNDAAIEMHMFHERFLSDQYKSMNWSDTLEYTEEKENEMIFSIAGVVSGHGTMHLWRMKHVIDPVCRPARPSSSCKERMEYIGYIRVPEKNVLLASWVSLPRSTMGDSGVVLFLGCSDGHVAAWSTSCSFLAKTDPCEWNERNICDDIVTVVGADGHFVSAIDSSLCFSEDGGACKMVLAVGKTAGIVQIYTSDEMVIDSGLGTTKRSLEQGRELHVGHKMDSHSISGVSCLVNGTIVVAASRLGNMATFQLPSDSDGSPIVKLCVNPIHCLDDEKTDAYKGYGCYGVSASPGGHFVAVARQCLEPDLEYTKQLQIHQRVMQGYVHIQSLIGPGAAMTNLQYGIEQTIDSWIERRGIRCGALWDLDRMLLLAKTWMMQDSIASVVASLKRRFDALQESKKLTLEFLSWRYLACIMRIYQACSGEVLAPAIQRGVLEMKMLANGMEDILRRGFEMGLTDQENKLSTLLASDWIMLQRNRPELVSSKLVRLAEDAYIACGEDIPVDSSMPPRPLTPEETNILAPMQGYNAEASLTAIVQQQGEPDFEIPRCPFTLFGNLDCEAWCCRICGRIFQRAPRKKIDNKLEKGSAVLQCPMCAGLVGPSIPDFLLLPPCT
eukprot:jgi/Picsp_1/442/NSC_00440-R1_---NA---